MKINVNKIDGVNFSAQTESGHEILMDGSESVGGQNKGARPMEVVLAGLGGCSAIDVISILKKSRQNVSDCKIEITADRADSIPAMFTQINLYYRVTGNNLDQKKVQRAISLSMEKYCSVTRMLEKTAKMSFGFEIIPE